MLECVEMQYDWLELFSYTFGYDINLVRSNMSITVNYFRIAYYKSKNTVIYSTSSSSELGKRSRATRDDEDTQELFRSIHEEFAKYYQFDDLFVELVDGLMIHNDQFELIKELYRLIELADNSIKMNQDSQVYSTYMEILTLLRTYRSNI